MQGNLVDPVFLALYLIVQSVVVAAWWNRTHAFRKAEIKQMKRHK